MLTNLLDGWFKINIGEGAFYAVFGFIFVFLGITLLILFFMALGWLMRKIEKRKATKKKKPEAPAPAPVLQEEAGVTPEVVAAITAALMAYYETEHSECEFVVRRIKRL